MRKKLKQTTSKKKKKKEIETDRNYNLATNIYQSTSIFYCSLPCSFIYIYIYIYILSKRQTCSTCSFNFPSLQIALTSRQSRLYVNFFQPKEEHTHLLKAIILLFFFYFAELRRFFQLNDKRSTQMSLKHLQIKYNQSKYHGPF